MDGRKTGLVLLLVGFVVAILAWTLLSSEPSQPSPSNAVVPQESAPLQVDAAVAVQQDAAVPDSAGAQDTAAPNRRKRAKQKRGPKGTDWLVKSLQNSKGFRVRVRAVLLLSKDRSPRATAALIGALGDKHPAVRTAAANSLGRRPGANVEAALKRTKSGDRNRKVKRAAGSALAKLAPDEKPAPAPAPVVAGPRYYVGVGKVSDPKGALDSAALGVIQRNIRSSVSGLRGVRLAPNGESSSAARSLMQRESRAGFYVDVSVAKVEYSPVTGTRATVSLMVGSYPGRDMRAILKGTARIPGGTMDAKTKLSAVKGAAQSAVRKLPQVFARSTR